VFSNPISGRTVQSLLLCALVVLSRQPHLGPRRPTNLTLTDHDAGAEIIVLCAAIEVARYGAYPTLPRPRVHAWICRRVWTLFLFGRYGKTVSHSGNKEPAGFVVCGPMVDAGQATVSGVGRRARMHGWPQINNPSRLLLGYPELPT
jgi:hypothetical protein